MVQLENPKGNVHKLDCPWANGDWTPKSPYSTEERVRAAYPGSTWERLAAIKRRYDPGNLFRLNQNVRRRPREAAHDLARAEARRISRRCGTISGSAFT